MNYMTQTHDSAGVRRPWVPMTLTKVGGFGDVLRGTTGTKSDSGGGKKSD